MNQVSLVGNLAKDPGLHYTQAGTAVVNSTIAINSGYIKEGTYIKKPTVFFPFTLWNKAAETFAQATTTGTMVMLTGTLQQRNWKTEEGGNRSLVYLYVHEFRVCQKIGKTVSFEKPDDDAGESPSPYIHNDDELV